MKYFLLFTLFLFPLTSNATETTSVTLSLSPDFANEICPAPVWKNVTVIWKGVEDKRPALEVGNQEKKGEIETTLLSKPALEKVFDSALQKLFKTCGMKLDGNPKTSSTLKAEINEFYVGSEKKLLTGKTKAASKLTFIMELTKDGVTTNSKKTVTFNMESKKVRSKDIQQLKETLDTLLYEILSQILKSGIGFENNSL